MVTISLGRPYASSIYSFFSPCMESNLLENSLKSSAALRLSACTPLMIQQIVRICEVMEWFLCKPFWFFLDFSRFWVRYDWEIGHYQLWRCPWCNGYRLRKWTRRHEFKSWTRLIAFHIALIPLGKVWIQLFSVQLWVNSRAD